ncbi:MAG: carboxymuconolactone decarboxylase family protein [Promethearchaeota archaeon]
MNPLERPCYTLSSFIHDISSIIKYFLYQGMVRGSQKQVQRLDSIFIEKILLTVTSVNECPYCSWFHAKMALDNGLNKDELLKLMCLDKGSCSREEVVALTFAQHFAESGGKPSRKSINRLVNEYGIKMSSQILMYILMITVGNKVGNTLEAFSYFLKRGIDLDAPKLKVSDDRIFQRKNIPMGLIIYVLGVPVVRFMGIGKISVANLKRDTKKRISG